MPFNQSSSVAEQPIIDTYVPLPFNELLKAGEQVQNRADKNRGDLKSLVIPSITEHDKPANDMINSWNSYANKLANDPNTNLADPRLGAQITQQLNNLKNSPNIKIYNRAIQDKAKYEANIEDAQKKGKLTDYNDPQYRNKQLLAQGINPYIDKNGNPLDYGATDVPEAQDWAKPVTDLFDKIKDSGYMNDVIDSQTGNSAGIKKGYEGVAEQKLNDLIVDPRKGTELVTNFLNSDGGRDFQRKQVFDNPKITGVEMASAAIKHMRDIAQLYVHGKSTNSSIENDIQAAQRGVTDSPSTVSPFNIDPQTNINSLDIKFDDRGNRVTPMTGDTKYVNKPGIGEEGIYDPNRIQAINQPDIIDQEKDKKQQDYINNIKTNHPELSKIGSREATSKEITDNFNKAVENARQKLTYDINPSTEFKKAKVEDIHSDFWNRSVTLQGGNPDIHTMFGDGGVASQLGYKNAEDLQKAVKDEGDIKIIKFGPDAGHFKLIIPNKNTDEKSTVLVQPDYQQDQIFLRSKAIGNAMKSSIENGGSEVPINGMGYPMKLLKPTINNGSFEFKVEITDQKGNKHIVTPEQIAEDEKQHLMNSGFAGTNLGTTKSKEN